MRLRAVHRVCAALVVGLSAPAAADDYDVMGAVEGLADGASLTLWVPFDREEQEPYATRMEVGVMTIYTIVAFSGPPGEDPRTPSLSLSFTIAGGTVRSGDLSFVTGLADAPVYGADGETGTLAFNDLTLEDDTVSVRFDAEAVELDWLDYEPKDRGDRITLTGEARVTFSD